MSGKSCVFNRIGVYLNRFGTVVAYLFAPLMDCVCFSLEIFLRRCYLSGVQSSIMTLPVSSHLFGC